MDEPSTEEEQFALRSESGKLMRIGRIAGHGALRPSSVSAQTSKAINEAIISPIDFEEIDNANSTKETGNIKRKRIQGFGEFALACPENVNRSGLINQIKGSGTRNPILNYRIYCICKIDR